MRPLLSRLYCPGRDTPGNIQLSPLGLRNDYESPHSRAPAFHRYSPESRAQTRLWNQDREVLRVESGSRMFWAAKCEIEFGPQLARKCGFGVSHENLIFLLEHP